MCNKNTTLSVCLLVYNHSHILEEIIESILAQTLKDFEFIISDDYSTDSSWDIIQKYAGNYKNIKAIKTPMNLGMAGNSNYAISCAKGKFIALLHHDDTLDRTLLEKWINVIKKSENIAFVFNDYNLGNNIIYHRKMNYHFDEIMNGKIFLNNYLFKYWGCPVRGTTLIRKKYFDELGGMDEKFGMLADVDLWMRLSAKCDVGYVSEPLIQVRVERPANYPKDYTEFSWTRLFILFDIHSANINKNNYPHYFQYLFKRFVLRNKISFEIIKWHLYGLLRNKKEILRSYPREGTKLELLYVKFIRSMIKFLFS